jgi:diacylglycerol O-acyltransferase / wax synthase
MIPLTSLDAALLLAETEEMPLHNLGLLMFDRGSMTADGFYAALRALFMRRIGLAPTFRRRLVQGRLRLGDLRFIEDPRFDLDAHVARKTLPPGAGRAEIEAFMGEYSASLLDRRKPLWEVTLLEGLASGEHALAVKIHHAAMDGSRLASFTGDLFAPLGAREEVDHTWRPEREPGPAKLALDTAVTIAKRPFKVARAAADVAMAYGRARSQDTPSSTLDESAPKTRVTIPPTPWQGALTRHRAATFADVPLRDLRVIREAYGTTINDVVLAAAAGALRRWLIVHHALPHDPLVANVPVAVKRASGEEAGNTVSMLRVPLQTHIDDPVERLTRIHAVTQRGKSTHRSRGSNPYRRLTDLVLNLVPPRAITGAVRLYSRSGGADLVPALWNLVISNIPGPERELYCGDARLTRIYPFGPVQQGSGLNLTVMSVGEHLGLGAIACREKVPALGDLGLAFADEVALLLERAKGP